MSLFVGSRLIYIDLSVFNARTICFDYYDYVA